MRLLPETQLKRVRIISLETLAPDRTHWLLANNSNNSNKSRKKPRGNDLLSTRRLYEGTGSTYYGSMLELFGAAYLRFFKRYLILLRKWLSTVLLSAVMDITWVSSLGDHHHPQRPRLAASFDSSILLNLSLSNSATNCISSIYAFFTSSKKSAYTSSTGFS